jgi:hypothetical protein
MEQQTLHMVTPAFLYPLVFYSEESLLLPLWYVYACNIVEPYDYGILEKKGVGFRNSFSLFYSNVISFRWSFVVGLCAGALVQYLHLLVGSLINNSCSPIL